MNRKVSVRFGGEEKMEITSKSYLFLSGCCLWVFLTGPTLERLPCETIYVIRRLPGILARICQGKALKKK